MNLETFSENQRSILNPIDDQITKGRRNYLAGLETSGEYDGDQLKQAEILYQKEYNWLQLRILEDNNLQKIAPFQFRQIMLHAMQSGLTMAPAMNFVYVYAFGGKPVFHIGYQGLIKLMTDSGSVKMIESNLIYQNDEFEYQRGDEPIFRHRPVLKDRGEIVGVYAEAYLTTGGVQRELLTIDDINDIRGASKAYNGGVWKTWPGQMIRKSAIRRMFKYLPKTVMSESLIIALSIDQMNDSITEDVAEAELKVLEEKIIQPEQEETPKPKRGRPAKSAKQKINDLPIEKMEPKPEPKEQPKPEVHPGNEAVTISIQDDQAADNSVAASIMESSDLNDLAKLFKKNGVSK